MQSRRGTSLNMLAAAIGSLVASSAFTAAVNRPAVQVRATGAQMADISAFDNIWGIDAKKAIFDKWDPEKPRDYENFNPFERNDESAMCDTNGCFPGQSRGYKSPNRPDQNWQIMQKEKEMMESFAADPKWDMKGKPGCFSLGWQKKLGAPP